MTSEQSEDQQPEENFTYLLQAGSFKIANDAESRRVKLLLLNLNASVELIDLGNGEKWHRVLVGPFEDRIEHGLCAHQTLRKPNRQPAVKAQDLS